MTDTVTGAPTDAPVPADAPSFSTRLWRRIEPIRTAIDALPFLTAIEDGALDRERFGYSMGQDARYLFSYGKALAAAAQADTSEGVGGRPRRPALRARPACTRRRAGRRRGAPGSRGSADGGR